MADSHPPVAAGTAGLRAVCPRCGVGALFRQGLVLRDACPACGLDYKFIDTGDGPAVFAIFLLGILGLGGALIAEFKFGVSGFAHVLLWGLLLPLAAFAILRTLKATLIALQYQNKAEQGRLAPDRTAPKD